MALIQIIAPVTGILASGKPYAINQFHDVPDAEAAAFVSRGHGRLISGGLIVEVNSVVVGTRSKINFVDGANATITGTDQAAQFKVDVEIEAAGA